MGTCVKHAQGFEKKNQTLFKASRATYQAGNISDFVSCQAHKCRALGMLGQTCVSRNGPLRVLLDQGDMRPRYNNADRI